MYTETELYAMNVADLKTYGKTIDADVKGNLSEATMVTRILAKQAELEKPPVPSQLSDILANAIQVDPQLNSGMADENSALSGVPLAEMVTDQNPSTLGVMPAADEVVEVKSYDSDIERVTEIMKDYPEVGFESQDNFFTLTYLGKINSGNITIPENVLRHMVQIMMQE